MFCLRSISLTTGLGSFNLGDLADTRSSLLSISRRLALPSLVWTRFCEHAVCRRTMTFVYLVAQQNMDTHHHVGVKTQNPVVASTSAEGTKFATHDSGSLVCLTYSRNGSITCLQLTKL